ncbi:MAG: CRTAC1 family protein [Ilumatobacter sp.]
MSETINVDAIVSSTPHVASVCEASFVRHDLDHTTTPRGDVTAMVDGTGTGVYADDLDDDGLVDIVLTNLSGETSLLWNVTVPGDAPTFERAVLDTGRFRQVVAADLDADGDRDLVLTTGIGPPIGYIQGEPRSFERTEIRTRAVAFSIAPGDLDGDGTIELATGSYNAELTANRDNRVLMGVDVGVAILSPTADTLASGVQTDWLTESAQALATLIVDIDGDGLDDIVVGNDLGTPDRVWRSSADLPGIDGLTVTELFDITSLSTMSIDVADIDNDGDQDLVTTDMARMEGSDDAVWAPVEADIEQARVDDIQQPRNAVQIADGAPGDMFFAENAIDLGVSATGWSWSGLLGDLDDDGRVDLYVVNGMQAESIFDTLPDGELVEANQAFRNDGDSFTPVPEWGLASVDGGRGMAQADVDGDGDLDIIINNLGDPAALWENRVCVDGAGAASSIIVEPIWSGTQNVDALGTTVTITAETGDPAMTRSGVVTGARGYISTSATQVHVGLGQIDSEATFTATVRWPDGAVTVVDGLAADSTTRVERTSAALASEPG